MIEQNDADLDASPDTCVGARLASLNEVKAKRATNNHTNKNIKKPVIISY